MSHRDELLTAARRLLAEKGYAPVTARDLVAVSGTNLASIGYHFGSKAGLLNEAIGEVSEEWTDQLAEIVMAVPAASPLERGLLAWDAMVNSLNGKRALLLSSVEALAQAERTPRLREQFAEQYRRCRTRVAKLVAQSLGEATTPDDPRCLALAGFVIAVCDGLSVQWLLDPAGAPAAGELREGLSLLWPASFPPHGPVVPGA